MTRRRLLLLHVYTRRPTKLTSPLLLAPVALAATVALFATAVPVVAAAAAAAGDDDGAGGDVVLDRVTGVCWLYCGALRSFSRLPLSPPPFFFCYFFCLFILFVGERW